MLRGVTENTYTEARPAAANLNQGLALVPYIACHNRLLSAGMSRLKLRCLCAGGSMAQGPDKQQPRTSKDICSQTQHQPAFVSDVASQACLTQSLPARQLGYHCRAGRSTCIACRASTTITCGSQAGVFGQQLTDAASGCIPGRGDMAAT